MVLHVFLWLPSNRSSPDNSITMGWLPSEYISPTQVDMGGVLTQGLAVNNPLLRPVMFSMLYPHEIQLSLLKCSIPSTH